MSSEGDKKKEMQVLCNLITWFDGYANLSCVDPFKIERAMKFCGEDVRGIWNRVKDDINAIGRLPGTSSRVVGLSRIVNVTRFFFIGFGMLAIAIWLLASTVLPSLFSAPGSGLRVIAIIAVVFNADLAAYIISTRRLTSAVKEYFATHGNDAKFQRKRVKDAAQALIDRLASKLKSAGAEAEKFQFILIDQSYANIRATRAKSGYVAMVRLQSS